MATKHLEFAVQLPHDSYSQLHIHLTVLSTSVMVFLTSNAPGESATSISAMGSFVYAMPSHNPGETLSTTLFTSPPSIDFALRASKVLARRLAKPVYLGCSLNLIGSILEDEMESLSAIVNAIVPACTKSQSSA